MTCGNIIKYIEDWAPKAIAWNRDNVGLQVGSGNRKVNNILLALEVNMKVIEEAVKKNCNLIITHHPLLFNPLKRIEINKSKASAIIEKLIKNDITLFSAHTNLDYTKDGVSFELAKVLKLQDINFLVNLDSNQSKFIVFVPESAVEKVADAIFNSGGGIIGEYSYCSFRTKGEGTFRGSEKTSPALGKKETYEKVNEIKLEVLIDSWKLDKVLSAVRKVHPYEEIAYDIIPLANSNINYGIGAVGNLLKPLNEKEFLKYVAENLNIKSFRYTNGQRKKINRVAVCGGSGSEYIINAIESGADAYITADIKYHAFFDIQGDILLIDAGHYETEIYSLNEMKRRLTKYLNENKGIKIFKFSGSTNPIIFYNN
jgi:dinuclear metal center YbgI/SA1388 family protein